MEQLLIIKKRTDLPNGRLYHPFLTASENEKGVLDVDTVKGCTLGMRSKEGGCYSECYAAKTSSRYGIDFGQSVSRKLVPWNRAAVFYAVKKYPASWYRVGTAGDPCHDWRNTLEVCEFLRATGKVPAIITKHWLPMTDDQLVRFGKLGAVINTSVSGFDTDAQLAHRIRQIERIRSAGLRSVTRVVTCQYGGTDWAKRAKEKQDYLLTFEPVIDNPLRANKSNPRVQNGDIILSRRDEAIGGGKLVSLHDPSIYLGKCQECPDQCGVITNLNHRKNEVKEDQATLFGLEHPDHDLSNILFKHVPSVIGSGYESDVSNLAIKDGIAKRAARKNMQIHSAIILLIDGGFAGFMTFQVNHDAREFCLLQSVIEPQFHTDELYAQMVQAVIDQNTYGYPAIITTDPKSKFETPKLFESLGFETYLKMSGFCYMVKGAVADVRMKLLAHITMTNVWNSTKGDWLRLKKEWRERIDSDGEKHGVANPSFASREGCWQGENGFANIVTRDPSKGKEGRAHNGNASVLDPVACEVCLRFFMPREGKRVYNPFGGGVQFGYIAAAYGYEYIASEIRQNQCDCNNKICADLPGSAKWIKSDSATYRPEGMFDLVFTCPPYYRVEKYIDYDGMPPEGEINFLGSYEQFRDALFSGYKIALEQLKENCFFVAMVGDSRNSKGGYYCAEAETELFMKEQGLHVYNRIVYLESEFTRLAQAKKTLNTRKFPKREQKIIVGYKGNADKIKDLYQTVGRL